MDFLFDLLLNFVFVYLHHLVLTYDDPQMEEESSSLNLPNTSPSHRADQNHLPMDRNLGQDDKHALMVNVQQDVADERSEPREFEFFLSCLCLSFHCFIMLITTVYTPV